MLDKFFITANPQLTCRLNGGKCIHFSRSGSNSRSQARINEWPAYTQGVTGATVFQSFIQRQTRLPVVSLFHLVCQVRNEDIKREKGSEMLGSIF